MFGPTQGAIMAWIALSHDTAAPVAGDTVMAGEFVANGLSAAMGTLTHTSGTTDWTLSHTFTVTSGGPFTIAKASVRDQSSPSGAIMAFEDLELPNVVLNNGNPVTESFRFIL
jgi:hypothetical protein